MPRVEVNAKTNCRVLNTKKNPVATSASFMQKKPKKDLRVSSYFYLAGVRVWRFVDEGKKITRAETERVSQQTQR